MLQFLFKKLNTKQVFIQKRSYHNKRSISRTFFDNLGHKLGLRRFQDWYNIKQSTILEYGGYTVMSYFEDSPAKALTSVYPEFPWLTWKFSNVPRGYWKDKSNHRLFFDWLGEVLHYQNHDDWYNISQADIYRHGGRGLLAYYEESPAKALTMVYPDVPWLMWKFTSVPRGFWKDVSNQRKFFDWIRSHHSFSSLDDWYHKPKALVHTNGGGGLLETYYNDSLVNALLTIYPEHQWKPWRFGVTPKGTWEKRDNLINFMNELATKLGISSLDDWYRVSWDQLEKFGALPFVTSHGGLKGTLSYIYPNYPWDFTRFDIKHKKSAQKLLCNIVKEIFPTYTVIEEYTHPSMYFQESGRSMQFDVYILELNIAIEYQGKQHYHDINIFGPTSTYKARDTYKKIYCSREGITLVQIPFWWAYDKNTIATALNIKV
eukprot:TRINITY_DN4362_c0_g1_i1.p1 TRINITY_DN4362_c0_g1~~TRINITY_DN4362_c0_g1_i1.p1  ORF type:complete len:431 (-),score=54.16 TRINITY_DN4362_c0_g1_i1:183-1475(-)